jgi:TRAP-type C4-dicarboxylate transport system permease small subunit
MIVRAYDRFVDLLASVAVVLLFAVMLGIGLDVGARYFLGAPIGWMFEFVQHSLLLILFLGLGWLTRQRGHVSVDILVDAVPTRVRQVLLVGGSLLSAGVCGHLAAWAVAGAIDSIDRNVLTDGIYPIPRGWLIGAIALGLGLTSIEFIRLAVRVLRNPSLARRALDAELDAIRAEQAQAGTEGTP